MGNFTRGIPFIGACVRFRLEAIEGRGQRQRAKTEVTEHPQKFWMRMSDNSNSSDSDDNLYYRYLEVAGECSRSG